MLLYISVIGVLFIVFVQGSSEGDSCNKLDKIGICVNIRNCTSATEDLIRYNIHPKVCSIEGRTVLVCCFDSSIDKIIEEPTLIFFSDGNDTVDVKNKEEPSEKIPSCPPVPKNYTTVKTGSVSWHKCIEYQQKYIFPCVNNGSENHRRPKCLMKGGNGVDNNPYEFSHVVMLGYGVEFNISLLLCGGAIISENFVLTAGHCVRSIRGNVTRVVMGAHRAIDIPQFGQIYDVKRAIRHPGYKPPTKYNDIALLETSEQIKLSEKQVPACLHTGQYAGSQFTQAAFATGWGDITYKAEITDELQKMRFQKFDNQVCTEQIKHQHRYLKNGFNDSTQLCYGSQKEATDTCDGSREGTLQIEHPDIFCMHLVLGVTSFDTRCGQAVRPAVYTMVEPYLPWIESIVWPEG